MHKRKEPKLRAFAGMLTAIGMSAAVLCASLALASPAKSDDFHGYSCTEDCSGHEAGYNWAQNNDIHDESDCSGNSQSFIEGCEAYTQENPKQDDNDSQSDDTESQPDSDTNE